MRHVYPKSGRDKCPYIPKVTLAITRKPAASLARGQTRAGLGPPDPQLTERQHAAYCDALRSCDVEVVVLEAVEEFPDSTFVEDTAVIAGGRAVVTRPGHPARLGEAELIGRVLSDYVPIERMSAPGRLDGGDVLEIDGHFIIGLSERTDEEGARQLGGYLEEFGYTHTTVPVGDMLHLKSGISYLGEGFVLTYPSLSGIALPGDITVIAVHEEEGYCANSIAVNGRILFPSGYPRTREMLIDTGFDILEIDVSEFRKMDGGLSCLSLRLSV